jgi:cyanophycinase
MKIQGKLIIIGGAVDKGSFTETNLDKDAPKNLNFFEEGILKRIIKESAKKELSRIEVITTASKIPREIGPEYVKAFSYLGANNIDVLYIEKREQASEPEVLERLKAADVVMFTGGDQLRLTSILGGTPFDDILIDKYINTDFIYAGTSAGAAAASNSMIYQGSSQEALLKGEVKITSGLGLIDLCDKIIKDDGTIQLFYNPFDKQLIQRNPNIALYCPTIKTLHQLQNLYYTLTGKELTYTP